jgi:hypothetical protein
MATSSLQDVILLIHRIFGNEMRYTPRAQAQRVLPLN